MITNRPLIELVTNVSIVTIEWLCFKILIDYLSEQKTSKSFRISTFLVCALISILPNRLIKSIVYIGLGFIFYKLNYKVTLYKSVIITSVFWTILMIIKAIGLQFIFMKTDIGFRIDEYNYFSSLEVMIFSVAIFIGTAVLYKYFKYYRDINKKYFIAIFFPICANILSFGIVLLNKTNKVFNSNLANDFSVFIMGILMILSNIFMIFLFRKMTRDNKVQSENAMMKEKMDMEYKYYSKMKENQESIRNLYHDMRNHMMCISNLENKKDLLKEYIAELNYEIDKCNSSFDTGNMIVDIILNEKKDICISKGIDFTANIEFSKCGFIKANDICTIFSNLIDNAIEACDKIEDLKLNKEIIIKSSYINQNFFVMKVENTKNNKLNINNGNIVTDKEDKLLHGIGIDNIKRVVYKYDGEVDIDYNHNKFIMKIIIPIQ
ncbi:MAG: sensor histidine kinase [Paraclostridium sp.]